MKQLLYIIILFYVSSSIAQTHLITLGKGEYCLGFNICNLHPIVSGNSPLPNETPVYISITKENKIQFSFPKNKMKETVFLKYFATGLFVLDGDYKLPEEIAILFKVNAIKTGKYKIVATADSYEVVF